MMKSIVNKFMKAILDELFIDAGNVQMSMGPDLFSESTIHLKNLTFRPDIFDVCLQPLHLISGHLGKLSVDGIAELALGAGKIGCQVENIFLLFGVDENADAEQVQVMKKLLVELQGRGPISRTLLRDLMKKIQGFPAGKDPDVRKKRKLLLKGLNYLFKSLLMTVKSVHIRIEVKNRNSDVSAVPSDEKNVPRNDSSGSGKSKFPLCSAIGITIPQFKLTPNSSVSVRPDGVGKDDPILLFSLKSLQVYCDYDAESYWREGSSAATVLATFIEKWRTEVHTGLLLPFDLDVAVAAEVNRASGLFTVKISVTIPKIRMICDPRQLEVIKDLIEEIVMQSKRREQLAMVENIFNSSRCPPKVCEQGGIHLLPGLTMRPPLGSKTVGRKIEPVTSSEGPQLNGSVGVGVGRVGATGGRGAMAGPGNGPPGGRGAMAGPGNGPPGGRGAMAGPGNGPPGGRGAMAGPGNGPPGGRGPGTGPPKSSAAPGLGISFSQLAAGTTGLLGGGSSTVSGPRHVPLPHFKYPTNVPLPRTNVPHLSATLKSMYAARGQKGWAAAMWRHAAALVISDIRQARPLGRWIELARLALVRRRYAFMYSKLLRRSNDTGNFVFNVNAKVSPQTLSDLFRIEMILPVSAVILFRTLASMIAIAESFNAKRRSERQAGTRGLPYERTNIMWMDILRIHSKLSESLRETVFHRSERGRGTGPYDENDYDDAASINSDESNAMSVRSLLSSTASHLNGPRSLTTSNHGTPGPPYRPQSVNGSTSNSTHVRTINGSSVPAPPPTAASKLSSFFGISSSSSSGPQGSGGGGGGILGGLSNAGAALGMSSHGRGSGSGSLPNSFTKLFAGLHIPGMQTDDLDSRLFGRSDLKSFIDFFSGIFESEERSDDHMDGDSLHGNTLNGNSNQDAFTTTSSHGYGSPYPTTPHGPTHADPNLEVHDWQLDGDAPSTTNIEAAVQWATQRHQRALILRPPDISLNVETLDLALRNPVINGNRKNVLLIKAEKAFLNLSISQAGSSPTNDKTGEATMQLKSKSGLASLAGSLIQFRIGVRTFAVAVHADQDILNVAFAPVTSSTPLGSTPNSNSHSHKRQKSEMGRFSAEEEMLDYMMQQNYTTYTPPPTPPVPSTDTNTNTNTNTVKDPSSTYAPYDGPRIDKFPTISSDIKGGTILGTTSIPTKSGSIRNKPLGGTLLGTEQSASTSSNLKEQNLNATTGNTSNSMKTKSSGIKGAGSSKMIKRVYLFSSDPNSIEVLASEGDQALVSCLMLDFDSEGEGAADFQMRTGKMRVSVGAGVLACLEDPVTVKNCQRSMAALKELFELVPILRAQAYLIDVDNRAPVLAMLYEARKASHTLQAQRDEDLRSALHLDTTSSPSSTSTPASSPGASSPSSSPHRNDSLLNLHQIEHSNSSEANIGKMNGAVSNTISDIVDGGVRGGEKDGSLKAKKASQMVETEAFGVRSVSVAFNFNDSGDDLDAQDSVGVSVSLNSQFANTLSPASESTPSTMTVASDVLQSLPSPSSSLSPFTTLDKSQESEVDKLESDLVISASGYSNDSSNNSHSSLPFIDIAPSTPVPVQLGYRPKPLETLSIGAWLEASGKGTAVRKAIIDNKNFVGWYCLIRQLIPKVLSVNISISTITADLLMGSTISDLISSKIRGTSDRAAMRVLCAPSLPITSLSDLSRTGLPGSGRRLGSQLDALTAPTRTRQSKITVKATEWRMRKDSTPSTGGFLELFGGTVDIVLPISDDDFHRLLALKLGKEIPLYF